MNRPLYLYYDDSSQTTLVHHRSFTPFIYALIAKLSLEHHRFIPSTLVSQLEVKKSQSSRRGSNPGPPALAAGGSDYWATLTPHSHLSNSTPALVIYIPPGVFTIYTTRDWGQRKFVVKYIPSQRQGQCISWMNRNEAMVHIIYT